MKSYILKIFCSIFMISCVFVSTEVFAKRTVNFGPEDTTINASIRYTVIGTYHSVFEEFDGRIEYDPETNKILSVELVLQSKTITSNCGWCDNIVRSKQLLATEQFPTIVFKSSDITFDGQNYLVKGTLDMHGVTQEYTLPFNKEFLDDPESGNKMVNISSQWEINRKDFDIIWNRLLDKGGVLVANTIIVDWKVVFPV